LENPNTGACQTNHQATINYLHYPFYVLVNSENTSAIKAEKKRLSEKSNTKEFSKLATP
jgi:hypothetical protein